MTSPSAYECCTKQHRKAAAAAAACQQHIKAAPPPHTCCGARRQPGHPGWTHRVGSPPSRQYCSSNAPHFSHYSFKACGRVLDAQLGWAEHTSKRPSLCKTQPRASADGCPPRQPAFDQRSADNMRRPAGSCHQLTIVQRLQQLAPLQTASSQPPPPSSRHAKASSFTADRPTAPWLVPTPSHMRPHAPAARHVGRRHQLAAGRRLQQRIIDEVA
jgi:hypothetical protein